MLKKILAVLTLLTLMGSSAYATTNDGRRCYGPVTLNTAGNYGPGPEGIDVTGFDGDMTVHIWKANSEAISVEIQSTLFTGAEDSTGASNTVNDTLSATGERTLKGPLTTVRFYLATCGNAACLVKAKICGRVAK